MERLIFTQNVQDSELILLLFIAFLGSTSSTMPFSLSDLVHMSRNLTDVVLGLIELMYPDTKAASHLMSSWSLYDNGRQQDLWTSLCQVILFYYLWYRRGHLPKADWTFCRKVFVLWLNSHDYNSHKADDCVKHKTNLVLHLSTVDSKFKFVDFIGEMYFVIHSLVRVWQFPYWIYSK